MDIKYFGHSSFFIKTKDCRVVTDPFDPKMLGLKLPKIEADIVTVSHHHSDHDFTQAFQFTNSGSDIQSLLVVDMPGEFEKKGVRVFGYPSYHDKKRGAERGGNILFKIEAEGITLLHLGDLGVILDDANLDQIGDIDILMIPIGGFYTIDPGEAALLSKKIEPSIIIPMHYSLLKGSGALADRSKLNQDLYSKLSPVDEFLEKLGASPLPKVSKFTLKKEELGEEEMKILLMEVSN